MSEELTKQEQLMMWQLFAAGGEKFLKDIEPRPKGTPHHDLAKKALVSTSKQGSSIFLMLKDSGWRWIADSDPFPVASDEKGVTAERRLLQSLTTSIKRYAEDNGKKIQDLIRPVAKEDGTKNAAPPTAVADDATKAPARRDSVETAIVDTFFAIAGRPARGNIRLSQLRSKLRDIPREEVDAALVALWRAKRANLMNLDNPRDIEAESATALKTGVHTFHVVSISE